MVVSYGRFGTTYRLPLSVPKRR